MAETPVLKDWKTLLEKRLNEAAYTEEDISGILYLCQDFLVEIQPTEQWVGQQRGYINQMQRILTDMYFTMFNKQLPPRPTAVPIKEVLLDIPELRKRSIREVALSITKPGDNVSDEAIFEELKHRGMNLATNNPTATISTILNGFKPEFEKVKGNRGVFKRRVTLT